MPPAHADVTAAARPIIERYIEVTGGQAAREAIRTVRSEGTLRQFSADGSWTSYAARPNRTAFEMKLGSVRVASGFDGQVGWRMGKDGKVLPLDGKELDDARVSAYFANGLWLTADQGGGHVAISESEIDSSGTCTVLEVTPPQGLPRSHWFNKKTGLIDRVVRKSGEQTVVSELSDYRSAGGLLVSFREDAHVIGKPEWDMSVTTTSVAVNGLIDDLRFKMPAEIPAPLVQNVMYYLKGETPVKVQPTPVDMKVSTSTSGVAAVAFGLGDGVKTFMILPGVTSELKIADSRPRFRICAERQIAMKFRLAAFDVKKDTRRARTESESILEFFKPSIPLTLSNVSGCVYELVPARPLEPGEYALSMSINGPAADFTIVASSDTKGEKK